MGKSSKKDKKKDKKREKKDKKKSDRKRSSSGSSRKSKRDETPEERQARKLAERKAKEKLYFGYTNHNNPFGDANLTTAFVWHKKVEKEIKDGKRVAAPTKVEQKRKRIKLIKEIESVQKRRDQREKEKEEMERLKEEEDRLRNVMDYDEWQEKEEEFHAQQTIRRTKLRIEDNREKVIDVLAKNLLITGGLNSEDPDAAMKKLRARSDAGVGRSRDEDSDAPKSTGTDLMTMELTEPSEMLEGLGVADLKELMEDMKQFILVAKSHGREGQGREEIEYWTALDTLCKHQLELREAEEREARGARRGDANIHRAVKSEVQALYAEKSLAELTQIETDIRTLLAHPDSSVDVEYLEGSLKELHIAKARAKLLEMHRDALKKRLELLEARQAASGGEKKSSDAGGDEWEADSDNEGADANRDGSFSPPLEGDDGSFSPPLESDAGGFSPVLGGDDDDAASAAIVDPEEDKKRLQEERRKVLAQAQRDLVGAAQSSVEAQPDESAKAAQMLAQAESQAAMDDLEQFSDEVAVSAQVYAWTDKYRPRKPRYFNRVKTGYDWNKYNQSHYDHDNPPPKTVLGYKFNIFYPDLIDKSQTPTYYLEKADSPEFVILRFHAGPPYQDIAFKIVNKEWKAVKRHGFKSVFERGVLTLYFNFARWFYRK